MISTNEVRWCTLRESNQFQKFTRVFREQRRRSDIHLFNYFNIR